MSDFHSDPLDLGADLAQRERDAGVGAIRASIKPIEPSAVCLHCGEPTLKGARWCDANCRDDYVEEPARGGW